MAGPDPTPPGLALRTGYRCAQGLCPCQALLLTASRGHGWCWVLRPRSGAAFQAEGRWFESNTLSIPLWVAQVHDVVGRSCAAMAERPTTAASPSRVFTTPR